MEKLAACDGGKGFYNGNKYWNHVDVELCNCRKYWWWWGGWCPRVVMVAESEMTENVF